MKIITGQRIVTHIILISSAYSLGKRIALHYTDELNASKEFFTEIQKDVDKIKEVCGEDLNLGSHCFKTDSTSWQSVLDNDCYFEGIVVIDSLDEFINLIQIGRSTNGLTIAKYILSKVDCTHLKLQKLVCLCYIDYMKKKNEQLFEDNIYDSEYGKIIESVYNQYKDTTSQIIDDTKQLKSNQDIHMPLRSRIMFTVNGVSKAISIDNTLEKYSGCSVSELEKIVVR